jgi:hypothetical protein
LAPHLRASVHYTYNANAHQRICFVVDATISLAYGQGNRKLSQQLLRRA